MINKFYSSPGLDSRLYGICYDYCWSAQRHQLTCPYCYSIILLCQTCLFTHLVYKFGRNDCLATSKKKMFTLYDRELWLTAKVYICDFANFYDIYGFERSRHPHFRQFLLMDARWRFSWLKNPSHSPFCSSSFHFQIPKDQNCR